MINGNDDAKFDPKMSSVALIIDYLMLQEYYLMWVTYQT